MAGILKILKSMGAKAIYVIDPINYRVQHALKNGAEYVFKSVDEFVQHKNGGGVDGETSVETADIEGNYDGNLQVAGTLSVSSSGVAKGEIRYKDLEIALGGKISGTIAEMSDDEASKSKIKLVKDDEDKKKSGGFFGTTKSEEN